MGNTKKMKLYELDPRFFKDNSGNGIGDLKGLASKIDYFDFLGVDAVILQNVLSSDSNDSVQSFTNIAKDLGSANDLSAVISKAKTRGTKIFLEIGIGTIKETHKWFNNSAEKIDEFSDVIDFKSKEVVDSPESRYDEESKQYYAVDSSTQEVPLNWKSNKVLDQFMKVIRFWVDLGVSGFVLRNFEYLSDVNDQESMTSQTLKELRKFYRAIKEIDDNIVVIGKSNTIDINLTNKYTEGSTKVFDYFMSKQISLIGTSTKFGNDKLGTFKPSQLVSFIKKYIEKSSNILSFGSILSGRINSRWGDHGQYSSESSKALGMLLSLTPASSSIYYGDELGMLNIGLTHLDDFQDPTLIARRKQHVTDGTIKAEEFMAAQVVQNTINSRSLMAWHDGKNGGFSDAEKTITPVNSTYREINVSNQFSDKNSSFLFYKELMRIVGSSTYSKTISDGNFAISSLFSGVIKMTSKLVDKEIQVFVNLSNKSKKIKKAKGGNIVLSSYGHKDYKELPTKLEAYEAIMISKKTDKAIKLTEKIKSKTDSEKQRIAIEEAEAKAKADAIEAKAKLDVENAKKEVEKAKLSVSESKKIIKEADQKAKTEILEAKVKLEAEKAEKARVAAELKRKEKEEIDAQLSALREKEKLKDQKENEKKEAKAVKEEEKAEVTKAKEAAKAEREAVKILKAQEKEFSIMDEEVLENERTTLKEEEIAATTQIDTDDIEDFDVFLENSKK